MLPGRLAKRTLVISGLTMLFFGGCEKSEPAPPKPVEKTETASPPAESPDEPLTAAPGTTLIQLDVQGMHCQGCGDSVAKKLRSLSGVKQARVSFNRKTGWVLIESGSTTAGPQLLEAVAATGYKATIAQKATTRPE